MKNNRITNHFLPVPFWSWNDYLLPGKTKNQLTQMSHQNIGGVVIHSRGGLQTPYMRDEWYDNIDCSISCAKKENMEIWIYDEDGWPSGFAGGFITEQGDEYRQKKLLFDQKKEQTMNTICFVGEYRFFYEVNPYYVDVLEPRVCQSFIKEVYEKYTKRYENKIQGFFTDEPQVSRYDYPWSNVLPKAYREAYKNEDLLERLPELFFEIGEWKKTRIQFWKLISDLFSKNYFKPLHDFCASHSLKLTGHLLSEESLCSQLLSSGAVMPQYEYFDIPGMDWLGSTMSECLTPIQVSSVSHQLGKEQVLSETFAGCGHNFTFDEMRELLEWQMVRGITRLCPHLSSYSLKGLRKRDHPPALSEQQPWWPYYGIFNRSMSRIGEILSSEEVRFDVLLIHPETTAWTLFNGTETSELHHLNERLLSEMHLLEEKHIPYHLGDETILARYGYVENNKLVVGTQKYTKVIILSNCILLDTTKELLAHFQREGGLLTSAKDLPNNPIIDNPNITATIRQSNKGTIYYFVNSSGQSQRGLIPQGGKQLDYASGDWKPFCGEYVFPKGGSLMVLDDGTPQAPVPIKPSFHTSPMDDKQPIWKLVHSSPNCFTMDTCSYWFDGVLVEESGYILDVMQKALRLEKPVHIRLLFQFEIEHLPSECWLLLETPEIYRLTCNGVKVSQKDFGHYIDDSFRKRNLTGLLRVGHNALEAEVDFKQAPEVYRKARQAYDFEVEKNRFKCDMEIEPFYLLGDFGIYSRKKWISLESSRINEASLIDGNFYLSSKPKQVCSSHLERQGFPFFAGDITLETTIRLSKEKAQKDIFFEFQKSGSHVVVVTVNGHRLEPILWEPFSAFLSPYLHKGDNCLQVTLIGNLRNMLGPHHAGKEPDMVRPGQFQKEPNFWIQKPDWVPMYCLVHFGFHSVKIKIAE